MMYYLLVFGLCYCVGVVCMCCYSFPYYGIFSLLFAVSFGCGMMVGVGGSFISLLLFLIYLGGMLVIFAYAVSLVQGSVSVFYYSVKECIYGLVYVLIGVCILTVMSSLQSWCCLREGWPLSEFVMNADDFILIRLDVGGLSWLYEDGCVMFFMVGWFLLMILFIVLELVSDLFGGGFR